MSCPASAIAGAPKTGHATNSPLLAVILLAKASVVLGCTVEQSTNNLFVMLTFRAVSMVSFIAASSAIQVKMISDLETASSIVDATMDLPGGSLILRFVARSWVRL